MRRQKAAASLSGNDAFCSGFFRFYGKWEWLGRGRNNVGSLVAEVENCVKLSSDMLPSDLGGNFG